MAWLNGLPIGQLGLGGLLTVVVLMILRGELVTRRQLLDTQADRDAWRKASENAQGGLLKLGMSIEKVVVLTEATNHALVEIQELASRAPEAPQ
jgi:hypothetical protein